MSEKVKFYRGKEYANPETNSGEIVFINDAFDESLTNDSDAYKSAKQFGSIYQDDKIVGTTKATELRLTENLQINGGPLADKALEVYPDGIPAGTSIEAILTKLFLQELFPNSATKPSIDIDGEKSFGILEVGSTVTIPAVSMTKKSGSFNANYTTPSQPSTGITWSNESLSGTVNSGFTGVTYTTGTTSLAQVTGTVVDGTNKITYVANADYSAPANTPLTNLGNETSDAAYTFTAGTATKTVTTTANGVYAVYSNGTALKQSNINTDGAFGTDEQNKIGLVNYQGTTGTLYVGFGGQSVKTWYIYLPSGVAINSAKGYNPNTKAFDIDYTFVADGTQDITTTYAGTQTYNKFKCEGEGAQNNIKFEIKK